MVWSVSRKGDGGKEWTELLRSSAKILYSMYGEGTEESDGKIHDLNYIKYFIWYANVR